MTTNMEDADIGRGRHRRQAGKSNKQPLIRIHGGVNLGGLVLFGGALAFGGVVAAAAFVFKKRKATDDDNKKSKSLAGDEEHEEKQSQPPKSNEASTLEGNHAEAAAAAVNERTMENCHGDRHTLVAHEAQEEIDVTPVHPNGDDMEASSSDESLSPEDVEEMMDLMGGAEATKLNAADKEIPAGYDGDEHEEEEEEEGEGFDPAVAEMEVKDKGSLTGETESNPKEDESGLSSIKNKDENDGEGGEEAIVGVVGMNTLETENGVIEEVDGYIEDDDVDDMASEEDDDSSSSNEEMEKDELEMLEGTETCSMTTESNAEAIIWPVETIESLAVAMALEDHLKKTATEGLNMNSNSSRESEEEEEDNEDSKSCMLLEKPMTTTTTMVKGQMGELISRRIWVFFPMLLLLLLLVMLLLLLTAKNPSSYYQSNAI